MCAEKAKEFGSVITRLIQSQNITRKEAKAVFSEILRNEPSPMNQGAFLAALAAKGETAEEIAGSWEAIYELDTVKVNPETELPLVDNSGTGMDSFKTFNISTAASIIAAANGIRMAKHGSRAITSYCGTIDILEELGVDVECHPEIVKKSIEKAGIGIFNGMSPQVHPQALGRILAQISFGTVLNIAASLANPALPQYGVRGVYAKEMLEPVARVMKEIGYKKALVVHGVTEDGTLGMDEASNLGETFIAELKEDGSILKYSFTPEDLGIKRGRKEEIASLNNLKEETIRMLALLNGKDWGARSDIVCLNAALIVYLMNQVSTIREGFEKAQEIIAAGKAMEKLRDWVAAQNHNPEKGLARLEKLTRKALAG
ncbi:anthranilate phosphoribosyltransferase [Desulfosporosinus youngiae]|uniref:Anthranilate phosphoribosyltransferase n=1 Tax=Desulfosporosinus youngiae DSM 17734 TaxID=768710 RepID=H5Y4Q2_9FIRM|nr:anthranilate phosphoribosyltransferase [Desulfosporosinus youngiae]EHQ89788.1 anthranilate phosphoribosyltransferase [Desulfosporosinus youngiae DSM 17734]